MEFIVILNHDDRHKHCIIEQMNMYYRVILIVPKEELTSLYKKKSRQRRTSVPKVSSCVFLPVVDASVLAVLSTMTSSTNWILNVRKRIKFFVVALL